MGILTRSFLPEEAFPRWEGRGAEQGVLKDGLDTSQRLYDIGSI